MRWLVTLTLLCFSTEIFAAHKKISCSYTKPNGERNSEVVGKLSGGAWRIGSLVFDTDDFAKDAPRATFTQNIGYMVKDNDPYYSESNYSVQFSTSPTHLTFSADDISYSINRSTLMMSTYWYEPGDVQCSISDVDIPTNRAF